ncbi:bifunctional phosphopantothenoylcysteine decarboxylase/phosphopantothenate--cysteine ligase CoaBC [Paramaledivibacter caminithermalis]|jgi:phosphopantothenoylcysteine decarboxylase/phosphopantothenate--cysteine ligase|uniref:Coenzyme A biosynthesis bifunctional protein CoaBC n=1 Tax=Paramaledivibacter caminithermalis (strain DSM 15212 / CIP 107654 / DViRD3) TaxID=1121301 RepID=A0A1M6NHA6_PARC5|nr:bifunctional phosphopantothenoylcysteine decarboxylase/phosphopantothenate--cysteine ligase CoaBC [Paramaledivibacter caminithermalis]SHJ95022.1 phosphopantothenoylcysteine decarboxylase / phosphopantothenate--cysteine ligase [Paramaledivibacter caminithermalis DSM 15212]
MLSNKNIVIGVSGGIAVYKALDVVSRLKKLNANIDVIMTKAATEFVQPLSFQSLSQNYVVTDMFAEPKTWDVEHISLAQKADLFVIAPATANVIGKLANGIADDMLSTTVMATKAPVLIAPAMNTNMYNNPIVQRNIKILKEIGYRFVDPASGRLACGDYGIGKLASPENIVESITKIIGKASKKPLRGKKVLVTAGPTQEPIDPVRYITNHSSGKMGYAIAIEAKNRGADVTLISGPTNLERPNGIKVIDVITARDMYDQAVSHFGEADIIIKAAAVADYRPKEVADNKIKKSDSNLSMEFARNPDILLELGKMKKNQVLIGFAAETRDLLDNAKGKMNRKNLDFIVANNIAEKDAGFKSDTNIVSIIDSLGNVEKYDKMKKEEIADIILDKAYDLIKLKE